MFYQFLSLAVASLSAISSGMHYGWTSMALPQLSQNDSYIKTTDDDAYWIAVGFFAAVIAGCFSATPIVNFLGQRNSITFSTLLFLTPWIIISCATSVAQLIIARVLCGAGEGLLMCCLPAYIAEISKPSIRGFMLSSIMVSGMTGVLLTNAIGTFANIRTTALISITVPAIAILLVFFIPESPYRLVSKGKTERAKQTLRQLRNTEVVDEELARITSAVCDRPKQDSQHFSLFTDKYNRKTVYICFGLLTVAVFSGNITFIFYTRRIFEEASGPISSSMSVIIYLVMQVVFSGLSIPFVDKVGRRPLLMISTAGVTITLFIECVYFYVKNVMSIDTGRLNFIPLLGLVLFAIAYNVGLQIIPSSVSGELFAPSVKFFALSLYEAYYAVTNMLVLKIFQYANDNFGIHVSFLIFALCNLFGFIFIYYCVPETKQKTLEQIQNDIRGHGVLKPFEMEQMFK